MYNWFKFLVITYILLAFMPVFPYSPKTETNTEFDYSYSGKIFGFGKDATPEEWKGWDTDVRYDGHGAPKGSATAMDGELLYENKCSVCHGTFGEGEGRWPKLSGGEGSLTDQLTARPEKTIGSYWPYAGTLWDYINRAMPYTEPNSLTANEVYALTAYILNMNEIIEEDFVLDQDSLKEIVMPNSGNFIPDSRPDTKNTLCMKNCISPKDIVILESIKGVTPTDELNNDNNIEQNIKITLSDSAKTGESLYNGTCSVCHANGVGGAPKIGTGNHSDWKIRLEQGIETMYNHAIEGYQGETGIMPAKGGFVDFNDKEIGSMVDYMVEFSGLKK